MHIRLNVSRRNFRSNNFQQWNHIFPFIRNYLKLTRSIIVTRYQPKGGKRSWQCISVGEEERLNIVWLCRVCSFTRERFQTSRWKQHTRKKKVSCVNAKKLYAASPENVLWGLKAKAIQTTAHASPPICFKTRKILDERGKQCRFFFAKANGRISNYRITMISSIVFRALAPFFSIINRSWGELESRLSQAA